MGRRSILSHRKRIGRRKRTKKHPSQPQGSVKDTFQELNYTNQESYESDEYFRCCFESLGEIDGEIDGKNHEGKNTDGSDYADEYYIILDRVYEDFTHPAVSESHYTSLKNVCKSDLQAYREFCCLTTSSMLQYIQCYESTYNPVVKTCVTIDKHFCVNVSVHGKHVNKSHELWGLIPRICFTVEHVQSALNVILAYSVCPGNQDEQFQGLVPARSFLDSADDDRAGYQERIVVSTVRSSNCSLLIKNSRCKCCCTYRRTLTKSLWRQKERVATPKRDWLNSKMGNKSMSASQKTEKLRQLRTYTNSLKSENAKLQRQLKKHIHKYGVKLSERDSVEMNRIMSESEETIRTVYPDQNSIQRLFWEQQLKQSKLQNKKNMKWHPMILKWCIYLKSKSSSTYDALRKTGFIHLPSERTLYDYSHVLSKGVGFQDDVICHLQQEVEPYSEEHQKIVGILQDEIKIKSDLVYDKHSGELVGFVDLDTIGNEIRNIDQCLKKEGNTLAKYVLVIMVQGMSTKLKYPLAHFATNGVLSDQLFTILWKAVEILEIDVGLTVLFITSDGASPNRRFIRLHGQGNDTVYRAQNIFASEPRYIYFISDPPHLIKTTRNNFSNSFSHKKSKKLWKNGQDISWMSIVRLYDETCSGVYRLCPKLSRNHVDLKSFNYMKVNLAAQVMSSTVANALEITYGGQYAETVKFIRHMDKFFDIMNTRNFGESIRKRNDNVKPFVDIEDERLVYLNEEFLEYFEDWDREIFTRPGNFKKSERNMMKLSYQTLEGLKFTVKSVTECIKFCLKSGMPFVLTDKFNQDAIEQHFGMHRASCGSNTNPTLDQFNCTLQKLRIVGSQALAPMRGNTKRRLELQMDDTPLLKKRRQR